LNRERGPASQPTLDALETDKRPEQRLMASGDADLAVRGPATAETPPTAEMPATMSTVIAPAMVPGVLIHLEISS